MQEADYYKRLGVARTASPREIAVAYRRVAAMLHPDRHLDEPPDRREQYVQQMRALNEAYAVLRDPQKRAAYDRLGVARPMNPWDGVTEDVLAVGSDTVPGPVPDSWPADVQGGAAEIAESDRDDGWYVAMPISQDYSGHWGMRTGRSQRLLVFAMLLLLGGGFAAFQALLAPAPLGTAFVVPLVIVLLALLILAMIAHR